MRTIAVTETIIGIQEAVKAANHAADELDDWLSANRISRARNAKFPYMEQTRYIQNIIRILPRINPAKQTPESCRNLIVEYEELADKFAEMKQNPATPEPVRQLVHAAGIETLVIIQGLPGLADRELAASNPYADALADALWHTVAIVSIVAGVAREMVVKR